MGTGTGAMSVSGLQFNKTDIYYPGVRVFAKYYEDGAWMAAVITAVHARDDPYYDHSMNEPTYDVVYESDMVTETAVKMQYIKIRPFSHLKIRKLIKDMWMELFRTTKVLVFGIHDTHNNSNNNNNNNNNNNTNNQEYSEYSKSNYSDSDWDSSNHSNTSNISNISNNHTHISEIGIGIGLLQSQQMGQTGQTGGNIEEGLGVGGGGGFNTHTNPNNDTNHNTNNNNNNNNNRNQAIEEVLLHYVKLQLPINCGYYEMLDCCVKYSPNNRHTGPARPSSRAGPGNISGIGMSGQSRLNRITSYFLVIMILCSPFINATIWYLLFRERNALDFLDLHNCTTHQCKATRLFFLASGGYSLSCIQQILLYNAIFVVS